MTSIAKKYHQQKNAQIIRVDPKVWKENKKRFFIWAKTQCMRKKVKDKQLNLLNIIISCCNMKGLTKASKQTMLDKYNAKHSNDTISLRTLNSYLNRLEKETLIKRHPQLRFNSTSTIKVLIPKAFLHSVQLSQSNLLITNIDLHSAPLSPSAAALMDAFQEEENKKWVGKPIMTFADMRKLLQQRRK